MNQRRVPMSRAEGPRGLVERAREFARGGIPPAVPRDAATVILLRQAPGVEAFLLQRTEVLEFAPGACVFPGGSVDEGDADPAIGWAGPSPADFAERLGTSPERARALVCAAVRETFEESGVLLAGPSPATMLQDSADLAAEQVAERNRSVEQGAPTCSSRGPAGSRRKSRPAASTPGSSRRPCRPGRRPRPRPRRNPAGRRSRPHRARRNRSRPSRTRASGGGRPRRLTRLGPARSRCCRRRR